MNYSKLSQFKDTTFDSFLGFDLCDNETHQERLDDPIGTTCYVQHLSGSGRTLYCWVSKNKLYETFENLIKPYLVSIFVDIDDLLYLYLFMVDPNWNDIEDLMSYLYGISRPGGFSLHLNTEKIDVYIKEIDYFAKTGYTLSVSGLKFRIDKNQFESYSEAMKNDTIIDAVNYKGEIVGKIKTKHIESILDNKLIQ